MAENTTPTVTLELGAEGETREQTLARWAAQDAAYEEAATHFQQDLAAAFAKSGDARWDAVGAAHEEHERRLSQIAADYAPAGK